jgi:dolichol-phosphate mannosyltransferase
MLWPKSAVVKARVRVERARIQTPADVLSETQYSLQAEKAKPRKASKYLESIAAREFVSNRYWSQQDPISESRMWWRAQTVRHMFHALPGETFLELGCGSGRFTRALLRATRGECAITAATFGRKDKSASSISGVEFVELTDLPGVLTGRKFDYVVGNNLLDTENAGAVLQSIQQLLRPGGRLVLFESNPWNPVFRIRRWLSLYFPFLRRGDERALPNRIQLYELLSEIGFIRINAICYDFLYRPLPAWLMFAVRNLSLVLENIPGIRLLSGSILVSAQCPPRDAPRPPVRMVEHKSLHNAISVVVPCHNEEMNVQPLVEGLLQHYDEYIHEFVLVDDNSTDRTREILERLASVEPRVHPVYRRPPNGVGNALRDGLREASGKYVLMMDCDFLHILPELRDMFDAAAEGYDGVLGSRFSRESILINYPLMKILCNRTFHVVTSILFHQRLRDLTNNLKLFKRNIIQRLNLESSWFAVNAETGLKPILMGFNVTATPISWINRTPDMGQSSFSVFKYGLEYLKVLGLLVFRTRFGYRRLK